MDSKRWVMRWWPLLYSIMWVLWSIVAPEPYLFNSRLLGHLLATIGVVGLIALALWPGFIFIRFFGTLAAILFPLHRAIAIGFDKENIPDLGRRVVASSVSFTIVLSLLLLYPSIWWISQRKDINDGD